MVEGGIISPTLANMTLDGMETAIGKVFGRPRSRERYETKINLVRYADDFVITGSSQEVLEKSESSH